MIRHDQIRYLKLLKSNDYKSHQWCTEGCVTFLIWRSIRVHGFRRALAIMIVPPPASSCILLGAPASHLREENSDLPVTVVQGSLAGSPFSELFTVPSSKLLSDRLTYLVVLVLFCLGEYPGCTVYPSAHGYPIMIETRDCGYPPH